MAETYSKMAQYYDKIYAEKDYAAEVERLVAILGDGRGRRRSLLDVACGTGRHLESLRDSFDVEGLDICAEALDDARKRNPGVVFHVADMTNFDLGRTFDVVTCLFSSIGYVKTLDRLRAAVRSMAAHLNPEGVLVVEPWFTPGEWRPNTVHAVYIDEPELKIARVNTSLVEGRLSILEMHYLVGTPEGTEHLVERHELGLFEVDEMISAVEGEGLVVTYDREGLSGRGLYLGRKAGRRGR
ncbi:MAG: class I SAM-dependent methyltransferase [Candidatus Bipolaricaulis sp.]|nr:class I SAM-dependent methyltransferase [Candidatus Bipolaricaulis sp.]